MFKCIKEEETVTLKCYGFGNPGFRYFAYDISDKEDDRSNNNKTKSNL